MSKFTPTRRGNPCPACDDEAGRCRHQLEGEIILCMTANSSRKGETVGNYKIIDFTKDGLWAVLKLDNSEWDEQRKLEWAQSQRRKREQSQQQEKQYLARLLPVSERNIQYRRIVSELGLSSTHREELVIKRGLTVEEIDFAVSQGWLCSWQHGKKIKDVSPRLAGVNPSVSDRSLVGGYGLAIATTNGINLTGFQIKPDHRQEGGAKYYWLSSAGNTKGNGPHLPNGELPVFVWRHPEATQITESWLVEGGLKSLITALKLWFRCGRTDIQVIGAAGAYWHGSINAVRCALKVQSTDKIVLCPDAGSSNNAHISRNYKAITEALNDTYKLDFAWWGQFTKGDNPDIDELQYVLGFELISSDDFFGLAAHKTQQLTTDNRPKIGEDNSELAIEKKNSKLAPEKKISQDWELWRKSRLYSSDLEMCTQHFSIALPEPGTMLAIKSGTGTGKTHWLINELIKQYSDDYGFLSLGYRNSLLLQFCALLKDWYHLQQDLKGSKDAILIADVNSKIAACLDSLIYFHPQDFDGKILILDETESIVNHLFHSETSIALHRGKIKELFTEALNRASIVILLDGHLCDNTVNFLQGLMSRPKKLIKVKNIYQGNKGKVNFLNGVEGHDGKIKSDDYSPIIEAIQNNPKNFAVVSDSQRQIEALDKILIEQGRKTLRLDSTTSSKGWVKAFLADPPKYIRDNQIEIILYSPSAEAGLNIDIKGYFSDIYVLFFGVITTNPQLQMIARIRDPEARISIFCKSLGLPSGTIHKSASCPEELAKLIIQYCMECGEASLAGIPQEELLLQLSKKLIEMSATTHFNHECEMAWLEEFERSNLRSCLREALIDSGYQVEDIIGQKFSLSEVREKVDEVLDKRSEVITKSEDINSSEVQKIVGNIAATPEDKAKVTKFRLLDRLPGIQFATYSEVVAIPQAETEIQAEAQIQPEASAVTVNTQTLSEAEASAVAINTQTLSEALPPTSTVEKPVFDQNFVRMVMYDSPQLISQLEFRFLVQNPEIAKELQRIKWYKKLNIFTDPERPDCEKLMNLRSYKSQWLKIRALLSMGVSYFLKPHAEWSGESPEVIAFYKQGKAKQKHTGLKVGDSTPCEFLGRALNALGIRTEPITNRKMRKYRVKEDSPIYAAIYSSVGHRISTKLAESKPTLDWETILAAHEAPKTHSQQGVQAAHLTLNSYTNIPKGAPTEFSQNSQDLNTIGGDASTQGSELEKAILATTEPFQTQFQQGIQAAHLTLNSYTNIPKGAPTEFGQNSQDLNTIGGGVSSQESELPTLQSTYEAMELEQAIATLKVATSWDEVGGIPQDLLNLAWEFLTPDDDSRLRYLYQTWEQRQYQQNHDWLQQAIATQANVKEIGFGMANHFRSYTIKKIQGGIAFVRKCWGDKSDCEIPINKLIPI